MATREKKSTIPMPTTAMRLRTNRRQASDHRLRGLDVRKGASALDGDALRLRGSAPATAVCCAIELFSSSGGLGAPPPRGPAGAAPRWNSSSVGGCKTPSGIRNPGIKPTVHDVYYQIGQGDQEGKEERCAHDHRVVALAD